MTAHMTAGAKSLKAAGDSSRYCGIEVAEAQMHDVSKQVFKNAHDHVDKFDEPEFFVVMVRASDPLIHGLVRQKFYSYPYLPSPRPEQAVWIYYKAQDRVKFLWSLPPAKVMAALSEANVVDKKWKRSKGWCDAFFDGSFWTHIRKESNLTHLSEHEYLHANREKLIQASGDQVAPLDSDAFDFSQITTNQVINSKTVGSDQGVFDNRRQA